MDETIEEESVTFLKGYLEDRLNEPEVIMEEIIVEHIVIPILKRDIYPYFSKDEIDNLFEDNIGLKLSRKEGIIVTHGGNFDIAFIDLKTMKANFMNMQDVIIGLEEMILQWEEEVNDSIKHDDKDQIDPNKEILKFYRQNHQKIIDLSARAKKI